ncbi:MAG: hypothetical protein Q4C38_03560 [bacterium]|nr:hypothetical protein [bacterium]
MIDVERKILIESLIPHINYKWNSEIRRQITGSDALNLYYLYETKNEEIEADLEKHKEIDTVISLIDSSLFNMVEFYTQPKPDDSINNLFKNRKEKKTIENIYLYLEKKLDGVTKEDIDFIVRSIEMPRKDIENVIIMSHHYEEDRAREIDFFNYLCNFFSVDDITLINRIKEVKEIDKYLKKENESKLKSKTKSKKK